MCPESRVNWTEELFELTKNKVIGPQTTYSAL